MTVPVDIAGWPRITLTCDRSKYLVGVYAVVYSDYEVVNIRQSYHQTKRGAYFAMRKYILERHEQECVHPNDLRGMKKRRGQRSYRDHYKITVQRDTIEILP